jgi:nucleoside-diphosphate kinase
MATERTFSIIKPDATRRNLTGAVTKMLEDAGLRVIASKRIRMSREQAEGFYAVHKERPFFNDLVTFMTSGPVVVQVLEGENAVARNREVMGATNPAQADEGTIRKSYAGSRPIRSTAPTARTMPGSKSTSSSRPKSWSARP